MSDFTGYEFKVPYQPKFEPHVKPEKEQPSKLDISLEELVIQEKKGGIIDDPNSVTADDFKPKKKNRSDSRSGKETKYVQIHIPREALEDLCKSLELDTNGYYVKMEAVLKRRK
ncbi:hypothetical protein GPJ56_002593 [Histomonas meleagridis]|uniref:uncharacterized protein n=1 Tax=Histomonas meleagridis TaxID=135588 RepID=UPI0035595FF1|nr:hypothetical protein GPJ56_002593 [Histomonas meleagridis]KAH0801385.1 hypothetical protein GO595_005980 [Histomonas meleagridis]